MTSLRAYLIRAVIDWVVDNDHTPHMVVDCGVSGVEAPREHIADGKLTLNISAAATGRFALGDRGVEVDCRFGGVPRRVVAPLGAVVGVYAKETGMGMGFPVDKADKKAPEGVDPPKRAPAPRRPALTLVRS